MQESDSSEDAALLLGGRRSSWALQ